MDYHPTAQQVRQLADSHLEALDLIEALKVRVEALEEEAVDLRLDANRAGDWGTHGPIG